MERKINDELFKWKCDDNKKILLLYGMRQIGKTYSVIEFGKARYKNIAYFDANNNIELVDIFNKEKSIERIMLKLSILSSETIFKNDTLIVFDNCDDPDFIKKLKIFSTEKEKYDVIVITSHKEILNKIKDEDFRYCSMHPMDFEEFLLNSDKKQLRDFIIDSYQTLKPMPFHQMALDLYNDFLITGGFPEVIKAYFGDNDFYQIEAIKQKIIAIYISDICLINKNTDFSKCLDVFNILPYQLKKENRKFQYGLIKKGGRSKDYENYINSFVANSIVNRSCRLLDIKSPLSSVKDIESFKLYVNDCGLLFTMLHLNKVKLLTDDDIRRCLVENNVANVLANNGVSLYYYQSDGKSEISFIVQNKIGVIIPIEVFDMKLTKAKSLSMFLSKYNIHDAIRITEDNFGHKKNIRYVPTYASFCIKDL